MWKLRDTFFSLFHTKSLSLASLFCFLGCCRSFANRRRTSSAFNIYLTHSCHFIFLYHVFFHGFAQFKQHSHYTSDSTAYRILVQHGFFSSSSRVYVCIYVGAQLLCSLLHGTMDNRLKSLFHILMVFAKH